MLSFFPGPSKVYPEVRNYLQDAYDEGILSIPHRGPRFEQLSRSTVALIRNKLNVPADYTVLFTSSATECWELLLQSLARKSSLHIFNGSFGEKWYEYARRILPAAQAFSFDADSVPDPAALPTGSIPELVCLTHNETSNGTQLPNDFLLHVRGLYPDSLLAVDATSSMGGLNLRMNKADIWFASVQKCFGLPAGLAIMLCSPAAVERARKLNLKVHYNSLCVLLERMLNYQTYNTPNVLGIYLLSRVLEQTGPVRMVDKYLVARSTQLYAALQEFECFRWLITEPAVQSRTVVALQAEEKFINSLHQKAQQHDILLGKGYGKWAKNTFRIANFPQHTEEDFERLFRFLRSQCA